MIFQNAGRKYPIRGIPDDFLRACYRTGPKGWNNMKTFPQWFCEARAYTADPYGCPKTLFVDNCGGHNMTKDLQAALQTTKTTLRCFRPCATDLVQPADSFVISKSIKDEWSRLWEAEKLRLINTGRWSSKLVNHGKGFFLQLARRLSVARTSTGTRTV